MQPLILVTNDDGVHSAGLRAAAEVARRLGEVLIAAPSTQQTGMARSFPRSAGLGIIRALSGPLGRETAPYYAVNGSPAQAVAHGVLEIAPRRPALCISGINNGENLGGTIQVSGTVGAAYEAACFGIPALAVSIGPEEEDRRLAPYVRRDWEVASALLHGLASRALRDGLPPEVALLNINIPASATTRTVVRTTAQSRQNQYVCTRPGPRDFSKPFRLPVAEQLDFTTLEPDSDVWAFLVDDVVSVTPLGHDLTVRDGLGNPLGLDTYRAT